MTEKIDGPAHYGGKDNPFEAIKIIQDWRLGFALGNALKYILRAKYKGSELEDLGKALWYLDYTYEAVCQGKAQFFVGPGAPRKMNPQTVAVAWALPDAPAEVVRQISNILPDPGPDDCVGLAYARGLLQGYIILVKTREA